MANVAVLGGGIGGLSAAHELAERGFSVTVYEQRDEFGGKARSFPGPTIGDSFLPAEHGFRFFPGFYQHVTDTMSRIPYREGSVEDNLVETSQILQVTTDRRWVMSTSAPETWSECKRTLWSLFGGPDVPTDEKMFFLERLLHLLSSCEQRWQEYDAISWWEFVDADRMSKGYQKILGRGIPQSLVALRPEVASTWTIGRIYLQLLQGVFDESMEADYVLNGPTNEVWIDPWVDYLDDLGVELRTGSSVRAIESDGKRVTGVRVQEDTEDTVTADYYVAALPVETMEQLVTPALERAAPSLRGLAELETAWMNGLQFYLERDVPLADGHGICYDSPWALTSISQRQFWTNPSVSYFEGEIDGILSVCISDWETPGILYGKPARECTPEEIKAEVWSQLKDHLNTDEETVLSDDVVSNWFLDPAIEYDEQNGEVRSHEPLLINTVGSLQYRPDAGTEAENLVLASDYVRTNTDLATMEAANEAARRAVNTIIDRSGSNMRSCSIGDLSFPPLLDQFRKFDSVLYHGQLPHPGSIAPPVWRIYTGMKSVV